MNTVDNFFISAINVLDEMFCRDSSNLNYDNYIDVGQTIFVDKGIQTDNLSAYVTLHDKKRKLSKDIREVWSKAIKLVILNNRKKKLEQINIENQKVFEEWDIV